MSPLQLEINKFSAEGEMLRRIRCLAGRVTVFRSQSDAELEKFKRALEGKSQPERFSVLADNSAFHPQKHTFIGFGPLDQAPPAHTVAEYLSAGGVPPDSVEADLVLFGLGGLSRAACSELEPAQWKMLRMAAICVQNEIDSIVIMHEPFDGIPDRYKNVYADKLAKASWEKNAIIVVTRLSYRPDVWIENDHIARVQLERPRQGTIGFGGGELGAADTIAHLRKELGMDPIQSQVRPAAGMDLLAAPKRPLSERLLPYLNSPKAAGISVSLTVVLCAVLFMLLQDGNTGEISSETSAARSSIPAVGNVRAAEPAPEIRPVSGMKKILSGYPQDVQIAWTNAIDEPDTFFRTATKQASAQPGDPGAAATFDSPIRALMKEITGK